MKKENQKKLGLLFLLSAIILVTLVSSITYYYAIHIPHTRAVDRFKIQKDKVIEQTKPLKTSVSEANKLISQSKDKKPFKMETLSALKDSVKSCSTIINKIPSMPKNTDDINKETMKLKNWPNSDDKNTDLEEKIVNYRKSLKQQVQITNPSKEFIINKLIQVETITGEQAATEDNDTNGNLNKPGGYTNAIVFSSSLVTEVVEGSDLIDKGTSAGGTIEVYANENDAKKRNNYLSSFDSLGFLNPGSHTVLGTLVIRTASSLTATQQKQLEQNITTRFLDVE
ncbi:MAG: EbhA [Candidatus Methanofastidiosa archaeon]|nr:EbhA [Candidatus Methanofastidiosa archaeon]